MAPVNNNKNPNIPKKQTGTVPKLSSLMMHNNGSNSLGRDIVSFSQSSTSSPPLSQQQQKPLLATTKSTAPSSKTRSNTSYRSGTSRKNTEVVAPTRRELNDLNDYLLITSVNSDPAKQQNNNLTSAHHNALIGISNNVDSNAQQQLDSSCYDIENINFQENQRFCYPVRPIPRRSVNKKQQYQQQNNLHSEQNLNISNTSSALSSAAVGVVIPTTPGNPTTATVALLTEDNYNLLGSGSNNTSCVSSSSNTTTYHNILCDQQTINGIGNNNLINNLPIDINSDLTWEERLNFIQYFLSVTSKLNNPKESKNQYSMVNEMGESKNDDIIVNSTSLEDVAQSESSDRAHSVSSIHTLNGAEPTTPNYEELQQRLENSNRNIQNIKDQQQQLLRLQQAAKQHLSDMETVRNQIPIRFNGETNGSNENGAPDYESVEQVHNDMSALVNRMKNLQTFIQNQNELSVLLGDDSPDLLAEQELLQQKLNELKSHRVEMRNLVDELQNINTTAEKTLSQQQQSNVNNHSESENHSSAIVNGVETGTSAVPPIPNRVVPVEYQRVVPIELIGSQKNPPPTMINPQQQNGHTDTEDDNDAGNDEMDPETADMIKQKVADINSMKKQLQRLKDMMMTVKLIEEKTDGPNVKDIGKEDVQSNVSRSSSKVAIKVPASFQKEFTSNVKKAYENHTNNQTAEEAAMSERVRLLHEMTDDLRNQALNLTSERDRLKSLREELKRRRDFEINEKKDSDNKEDEDVNNVNNNTLQYKDNSKSEQNILEAEYEEKKKEFRRLCERLQSEEDQNDDTATVTGNEDNEDLDDEPNEQTIKPDRNFYTSNWQRNAASTSCNSSINQEKNCSSNVRGTNSSGVSNIAHVASISNRGKDSADSGAADVHGNGVAASIEAGSIQSGSSRSFSMPPPMRSINNPVWRKNSHEHAHTHGTQPVGCEHYMPGMWNPYAIYQNPYGYIHPASCGPSNSVSEFPCPGFSWNNLGVNTTTTTNSSTVPNTNDPVLLQQFIQTQQMLINSVCQCNQMLWHQQREINNLNNTVVLLQERIINANPDLQSLQGNNRSESVPPLAQNNTLFSIGMNRAQSEQPLHAAATIPGPLYSTLQQPQSLSTPISPNRQCYNYNTNSNFLQQQQQQRRQLIQNQNSSMTTVGSTQQSMTSATSNLTSNYNYSSEQTPTGIYTNQSTSQPSAPNSNHMAFNNSQPIHFLNNDPAHQNSHSAGPIFMHHHNNNIGGIGQHQSQHAGNINNSNSNLLHQNATNSPTSTTASVGALNNQVAPGTRANNYWDNFRSYSRQNLLSSNSCKSNEELNHQMQHQQHLQQQQQIQQHLLHQQQQQQSLHSHVNNSAISYNLSPIPSTNNINIQNECRPLSSVNGAGLTSGTNLSFNVTNSSSPNIAGISSNNLNPSNYDSKYFHTFRNEFNSNNQQSCNSTVSSGINQPINLPSSSITTTPAVINASSNLNVDSGNTSNPTVSTTTTVPFNNINGIHNLEVNQGGSASSNLSLTHSDNLNENVFDFNTTINSNHNNSNININNNNINNNNNNNNNNGNNNNGTNVASFFGSPDFRNMNFNFGLHEPKKVPMKTACATSTKRLRHTQSAPNNIVNLNDAGELGLNDNENNSGSQNSHNFLNDNNNDNHRYEEMGEGAVGFDETSEEIKRNLLVNALKSDKFTSKFFESLKEDVYRQAYAIIQEKKSDPQFLAQLFEEIKGAPAYDPLRNMLVQSIYNLNRSSENQPNHHRTNNDTESNDGDNEMENEETSSAAVAESVAVNTVVSSTGPSSQNYFKIEDNNSPLHSSGSQQHLKYNHDSNVTNDVLYNSIQNFSNSDTNRDSDVKSLFLNSKELKFPHDIGLLSSTSGFQQKNKSNDLRNERLNQQYQMRNFSETWNSSDNLKRRPESHIISYTIFKIRKEIQKQQIDDATLFRIVKITIQTLEDAIANLQQPSPVLAASLRSLLYRIKLSTKEIYSKMKNFQNQEKDNFLTNYQSYLNKLLLEDSNNINLAKSTRHLADGSDLGFWQNGDINQIQNKTSSAFNNQVQWNESHNLSKQNGRYKSNISSIVGNEAKVMNSSENQNGGNEIFLNLNQQNVHTSHRHQQNRYQHQPDMRSPNISSNNMVNEDLAEADQICSSSNQVPIRTIDNTILENNNKNNGDSKSSSAGSSCIGAVGFSNIPCSNEDMGLILNDQKLASENIKSDSNKDIPHSNGNDIDDDPKSNIIDCCDNDRVEDDQDFTTSSTTLLLTDSCNLPSSNGTKTTTRNSLSTRQKYSKNNKKTDTITENNENIEKFNQHLTNNADDSHISYMTNNKSNNLVNIGCNNPNSVIIGRIEGGDGVIVSPSRGTINNSCACIFPMGIQSDSIINNNLDSGYQSLPQPDCNLSNSNTESAESNGSSTELGNGNSNSVKRSSAP